MLTAIHDTSSRTGGEGMKCFLDGNFSIMNKDAFRILLQSLTDKLFI